MEDGGVRGGGSVEDGCSIRSKGRLVEDLVWEDLQETPVKTRVETPCHQPLYGMSRAPRSSPNDNPRTPYMLLHERVDVDAGARLICSKPMLGLSDSGRHAEWRSYSNLVGLAKGLGGSIPVQYYLESEQRGYGRFRSEVSVSGYGSLPSYTRMLREVRAHLADRYYFDIDMVNSTPVLLEQLLQKYGIRCAELSRYVLERDACIADICQTCGVSRDDAKGLLIRILFFGTVRGWMNDRAGPATSSSPDALAPPPWVSRMQEELQAAARRLLEHADFMGLRAYHKERMERAAARGGDDDEMRTSSSAGSSRSAGAAFANPTGKTMALLLQTQERKCLEALVDAAQREGRTLGALVYDGVLVEKEGEDERELDAGMLRRWEDEIWRVTGYRLRLLAKPFEKNPVWLADDTAHQTADDETWMEKTDTPLMSYEDMKASWERSAFKVVVCGMFVRVVRGGIEWYTRSKLIESYEHLSYSIIEHRRGAATVKKYPFIYGGPDLQRVSWLTDPQIRRYEEAVMLPPPMTAPASTYNTWTGFAVQRTPPAAGDPATLAAPLLEHVDMLLRREPAAVKYMLDWLAHIFQSPGQKCGVAVLLKGLEGVGKNRITDAVRFMLGDRLYVETARPSDTLYGQFNDTRRDRLLIVINEASGADNHAASDVIKDMITGQTFVCNAKHQKPITLPSYERMLWTTNNSNVLKLHHGSRRFVIFDVSPEKRGDLEYFTRLSRAIADPAVRRAFYDVLMARDLSDVDWIKDRPIGEYHHEMVQANLEREFVFLREELLLPAYREGRERVEIGARAAFGRFDAWLDMTTTTGSRKYETNETRFCKKMSELVRGDEALPGCTKVKGVQGNMYVYDVDDVCNGMRARGWVSSDELYRVTQLPV